MWQLAYDGVRHGFIFYPFSGTGSSELFTGNNSASAGTWIKVAVQYKATSDGGAQLYLNGQTQPSWGVSGNYTRTADLQRLQLWNEGLSNNDFDDVSIAGTPPPGATPPGAPTNVVGSPLDRAVSVSWTAPASDGGSPITGYRITPFIGTTAQSPVLTGSAATNFTVAGLTDGTAYTFKVSASNAAGNGSDSAASAPVTPQPAPPPGPPTGVTATAADASAVTQLDGARLRRWQPDHQLPDHAVHQRRCADADQHGLDGDHADRDRAQQWHDLHVLRRRAQRDRRGPGVDPVDSDHADPGDHAGRADGCHRLAA